MLVVGAGPTGLVLGAELLARGISTRIIDKGGAVPLQSRAIGIHGRTLEVLDMPDVDSIRQIEELGVTHVMTGYFGTFNPYGMATDTEPLGDKIDRLRRFGDDVIAKFRG